MKLRSPAPGVHKALTFILIGLLLLPAVSYAQDEPPPEEKRPGEEAPAPPEKPKKKTTIYVEAGKEIQIDSLLEQIGKMTGKSIVSAPNISGRRIKFVSSFAADYYILEAVLQVNGITLEHKEINGSHMIKALTDREVRKVRYGSTTQVLWIREPADVNKLPEDNELVTAIFEIKYADPTQIERTLTNRLVDRQGPGSIVSVTNQPVIIARDFSREIRYYAEVIRAIDVMPKSVEMRVYSLEHAIASDVAQYLQQLAQPTRVTRARPGTPLTTGLEAQFVADIRTNKLIVLTFPENFKKIEEVIKELDEELPEGAGNIHIYMLKHMDADKMAATLQAVLSSQAQRQYQPRRGTVPQQLQVTPSRVVSEPQTNSLIIEADKKNYDELLTIIKKLDVRRPQVLLEVAIIEVSANSTTNMGIELATVDQAGVGFRFAGGSYFGLSALDPEELTKQPLAGLGATMLGYKDEFNRIPVLLQMLRTNSDVNVLSSPRILTNDNEEGEIKVTDQVATTTYIDPQTGPSRQTFGSYQEAGITLTITPHISSDDYLRLEIHLKIEQFTAPPIAGSPTPPPKTTREIKGMVTVPDREIIVIGGLKSEEQTETVNKIPILGDIPILGTFFRSTTTTKRETNLYVFLTPHIIHDDAPLKKISRRQLEDARLLGGKTDEVSQIMKDLPAYYARRRSKSYLELRETIQDIWGRDFKKVFVIERPKVEDPFAR